MSAFISQFGLYRSFVFSIIFFQSARVLVPKLKGGALTSGIVYIASEAYLDFCHANLSSDPKLVPPPSLFPNRTSLFFSCTPDDARAVLEADAPLVFGFSNPPPLPAPPPALVFGRFLWCGPPLILVESCGESVNSCVSAEGPAK